MTKKKKYTILLFLLTITAMLTSLFFDFEEAKIELLVCAGLTWGGMFGIMKNYDEPDEDL